MKSPFHNTLVALALSLGLYAPRVVAVEDATVKTAPVKVHDLLPPPDFKVNLAIDFSTHTLGRVTVATVGPGSFAEKAGLKVDDVIVAVNGKAIVGMQPIELTTFI